MIRVLHVVADPAAGAILVAPIARRQSECGYSVEFACGPGEYLNRLRKLGFPVTVIPIARRPIAASHVAAIYQLWRLMRRRRYHVVHTHTPVAAFLGRFAAFLARVPVIIYHMRGSWWSSPKLMTRAVFTIVEWIAGRWTTHTFTINCSDADELVARGIAAQESVTCLHCGGGGVDIQRFDPSCITGAAKNQLRAEFEIEESDCVVGFIGRLVREKGILELLTAFREVSAIVPDAKLVLVGGVLSSERDQTTIEKMRELVSNSDDLARRVIFTGFREDIPRLISIMDVVVLPSHREGFGMVLAEAAAMARPVITTNTRGGREAVIHGTNGLLVPIGDSEMLRDALLQLAFDPKLRHRMGEEGRRMALERFDERLVFEKVKAEYARLLRERGLPVPSQAQ